MNKKTIITVLLILFAVLTAASILTTYYTFQLPTQETTTITLYTYQQTGTYNYIAKLKPNLLYTQPTLGPNEGILYIKIIDQINITFSYTFQSSHPTNKTLDHNIYVELESPEKWTKQFTTTDILQLFKLTVNSDTLFTTLSLNITLIDTLVDLIEQQTGTSSTTYNINIENRIQLQGETDVGTIDEYFTPKLKIEFNKATTIGSYISIEDLTQTEAGTKTEPRQVHHQEIVNARVASIIVTVATLPVLAVTAWFYLKAKPTKPTKKPIKDIIAPYKEIIAETTKKPPETTQTITMETLEDLAKIAENLVKPILHKKEPETNGQTTHTFYILDNNTKYQYTTTTTNKT